MSRYRVQAKTAHRIDEIYDYTHATWGEAQAERYVRGLFARFEAIADRQIPWRPIPAQFGVEGFVGGYEQHVIYWKILANGEVGIVTVLHERMHQIDWFREDFGR